jgi:hypothetical protein
MATSSSITPNERVDVIMRMLGDIKLLTQNMKEDKEERDIHRDIRQKLTKELCGIADIEVSDDAARRLKTAMTVYTYYIKKKGIERKWDFDARKERVIVAVAPVPWSNNMEKSVQEWRYSQLSV